jgi:hypothetical protein
LLPYAGSQTFVPFFIAWFRDRISSTSGCSELTKIKQGIAGHQFLLDFMRRLWHHFHNPRSSPTVCIL